MLEDMKLYTVHVALPKRNEAMLPVCIPYCSGTRPTERGGGGGISPGPGLIGGPEHLSMPM